LKKTIIILLCALVMVSCKPIGQAGEFAQIYTNEEIVLESDGTVTISQVSSVLGTGAEVPLGGTIRSSFFNEKIGVCKVDTTCGGQPCCSAGSSPLTGVLSTENVQGESTVVNGWFAGGSEYDFSLTFPQGDLDEGQYILIMNACNSIECKGSPWRGVANFNVGAVELRLTVDFPIDDLPISEGEQVDIYYNLNDPSDKIVSAWWGDQIQKANFPAPGEFSFKSPPFSGESNILYIEVLDSLGASLSPRVIVTRRFVII
jgi:hypothetical protein